jgi:FAD/FMN-containing dehydrogenase
LTCDALSSATIVLPTGQTVTASAADHDDLFWALRGGGGGHFGVVTSLRFRTYPVSARDVISLVWPKDFAAQALRQWSHWMDSADRAIWGMVTLNGADSELHCSVTLATAAGDGRRAADDLSEAIGTPPDMETSQTLSHPELVRYFAGGDDATRPRPVVAGSDIIGEMNAAAAESIVAAVSSRPSQAGAVTAIVESLSGAVHDIEPSASAFPWRRQAASVQWYTEAPTAAAVDAAAAWLKSAHEKVRTHSAGAYVNYVESGVAAERYFAANLARLKDIREKYDPDEAMFSTVSY